MPWQQRGLVLARNTNLHSLNLLLGLFIHHHRQDHGSQAGEGEGPDQSAACPFF